MLFPGNGRPAEHILVPGRGLAIDAPYQNGGRADRIYPDPCRSGDLYVNYNFAELSLHQFIEVNYIALLMWRMSEGQIKCAL